MGTGARHLGARRRRATAQHLSWVEQAGDGLLHFHADRPEVRSPGARLLRALLEDAIACLELGPLVDAATRADAVAWLQGDVDSAPLCSFREVCEVLDLDEDRTRSELLDSRRGAFSARSRWVA